ncbi:MAG: hypothetical protein GF331_18865 [Chitinivibrionales bacterium]|nr:hypothetical protein [Chitinivibrionales bacterium]
MIDTLLRAVPMVVMVALCAGGPTAAQGIWVRHASNPVLARGPYPSCDFVAAADCCVRRINDTLKMWYASGGLTPPDTIVHTSISYAWSLDGITWTKHEANPVLNNDPMSWDALGVETPTVLYDPGKPDSLRYRMWYAGHVDELRYDIGFAWSSDGIAWTKSPDNPVLTVGPAHSWENAFLEGPTVVAVGDTVKMWYAGVDMVADGQPTDNTVSIGYAWSTDNVTWQRFAANPVLTAGTPGLHDSASVQDPCVLLLDGTYHMWYGSLGTWDIEGQQIGYATSPDGVTWTKHDDNPVVAWGEPGAWDSWRASFPAVVYYQDSLRMWYTGMDTEFPSYPEPYHWDIGYAVCAVTQAARIPRTSRSASIRPERLNSPGQWYTIDGRRGPRTGAATLRILPGRGVEAGW